MGGHPVGEPNEADLGPDGMAVPWQVVSPEHQPMPPCHRCGAAFAAHIDGRCPQTGPITEDVTAPQWAGIQGTALPYAYWVPTPGGPPPVPQLAGPAPPWRNWPRRHPLLTGAIVLIVLLASGGIVLRVSQTSSQTSSQTTASQATNGNATACSDYWNMTDTDPYDAWGEAAGWRDLEAAAPGITNPALWRAVQGFDDDLSNNDVFDAGPASIEIGTACTALGYGNPG